MALMLSGRMKPKSGTVTWNGHTSMNRLRRVSAVVDSPNINEPEAHLRIRDIVSEDLSLIPSPPWRKPNPKKWMERHGFSDIAHEWTDAVESVRMTDMLTQLAAENPQTKLLVVDSPDRHQEDDEGWLRNLERYTYDERRFAVIALVGRPPAEWDGPMIYLGDSTAENADGAVESANIEDEAATTNHAVLPAAEMTELADVGTDTEAATTAEAPEETATETAAVDAEGPAAPESQAEPSVDAAREQAPPTEGSTTDAADSGDAHLGPLEQPDSASKTAQETTADPSEPKD